MCWRTPTQAEEAAKQVKVELEILCLYERAEAMAEDAW
jgi:hypothetical protein